MFNFHLTTEASCYNSLRSTTLMTIYTDKNVTFTLNCVVVFGIPPSVYQKDCVQFRKNIEDNKQLRYLVNVTPGWAPGGVF